MARRKPAHRFSLLLHVGEQGEAEVCALDGEDGPDDTCATLAWLVEDWIADTTIDSKLHPYIDDTLWMLGAMNDAQRRIVASIEDGDPHVPDMIVVLDAMQEFLHRLAAALEAEP